MYVMLQACNFWLRVLVSQGRCRLKARPDKEPSCLCSRAPLDMMLSMAGISMASSARQGQLQMVLSLVMMPREQPEATASSEQASAWSSAGRAASDMTCWYSCTCSTHEVKLQHHCPQQTGMS